MRTAALMRMGGTFYIAAFVVGGKTLNGPRGIQRTGDYAGT